MAQAKTPTVRKPKFEANQIQRTKPIGKPTRKEFGSPTITDAALVRRRLLSSAALLTGLGAVLFPLLVEAAAAESQASETHLAEVPLASGATLTVERSGQVALFGINRPQIQNRLDPTTFRALATAYYDYDHDPSLRAAVLFGHGEHFSRGIDIDAFKSLVATQQPWIPAHRVVLRPSGNVGQACPTIGALAKHPAMRHSILRISVPSSVQTSSVDDWSDGHCAR